MSNERCCASLPAVVAIGVFDGLHVGHRTLISDAAADAAARVAQLVILTFDPDPDEFFQPAFAVQRKLMSNACRLDALAAFQPQARIEVLPGTAQTFSIEPQEFLERLHTLGSLQSVHVGNNFRFGARAAGDVALLAAWCASCGIASNIHELVELDGAPVSSTRIRELLLEGKVAQARRLLGGRCHRIEGCCERGRGEGTGMGFATANLSAFEGGGMLVAEGVYAAYAYVSGVRYACAVNVGRAKSFENATALVEAHLLGFTGELYGQHLAIDFVEYLRPQKKFDDMAELIATVKGDIRWVREHLEGGGSGQDQR